MHRLRLRRRPFASLAQAGLGLVWLWTAALGCNRDTCAGLNRPSSSADAPQLVSVEIVNQDVINPWQFNLAVSFTDRNGDMGTGLLLMYVGTSQPVALSLVPYFASSGIAPTSHAGRLGVDVNLASSSVQDDNVYRMGFQLRDALSNYSNCYTLDLHFDIDRLSSLSPARARRVPCGPRLAMALP